MESKTFNSAKYGTITATRTKKNYRSNNLFTADKVITKEEAGLIQIELGYHPAGYSFTNYKTTATHTTWECWNSCD